MKKKDNIENYMNILQEVKDELKINDFIEKPQEITREKIISEKQSETIKKESEGIKMIKTKILIIKILIIILFTTLLIIILYPKNFAIFMVE